MRNKNSITKTQATTFCLDMVASILHAVPGQPGAIMQQMANDLCLDLKMSLK